MDYIDTTYEKELSKGHCVIINTKGKSMRPLIYQGKTQVLISPIKDELKIGDMPLVRLRPGVLRLHRIVKMNETGIFTRGDNCISIEKINKSDIIGIASCIYRGTKCVSINDRGYKIYKAVLKLTTPIRIPFFIVRNKLLAALHFVKSKITK